MAYRDYNGKITIDENAAKNDVRKINAAIAKLETARGSVSHLIQQSSAMKGQTGQAIASKSGELQKNLDVLIRNLRQEVTAINQTVAKYKRLDQQVKAAIQRGR
ncbi:MAG: hypothetical protein NC293_02180 [Roseburia sp.]|nr:hypothetical protein [Roseburia sp.]